MTADDVLGQAWASLSRLFMTKRDTFLAMSRQLGLTPPQTHALLTLAQGPVRMRSMADTMACDASYITSIVDRLEELGLAERQPSPVDRRVKEVALTPAGLQATAELQAALFEPPAALRDLPERDQRDLARIARRLAEASDLPESPFGLR